MGKLVVSLDGVVIKEVQITKDKTSLGRRPYNDIVIDNLAVSGEHAVLQMVGADVFIEDLNSTNGTYINGRAVKKQLLQHNDTVEIGKYKIKYLLEEAPDFEKTMVIRPGANAATSAARPMPAVAPGMASATTASGPQAAMAGGIPAMPARAPMPAHAPSMAPAGQPASTGFGATGLGGLSPSLTASIKVLNGAAAGREVQLTKVVTTVGKPGVQVASITKRPGGYVFAHVEGGARPSVNGQPVAAEPVHLKNGDVIELAGTQMQFVQV
ncbi:FHA domain-containing protein [Aquabacterium lacunae]|uniref:FHA domain-containing protein n=1 Tax=Aquabacterium lacunae TaxID=2528630 RepID=A0A4Q9GYF7_9BURK|nr:FHA domain-containing protein [Aquabacterium lacunae]TBO31255.1 FHA domain-containing protein [Aquabacterium lacunae]